MIAYRRQPTPLMRAAALRLMSLAGRMSSVEPWTVQYVDLRTSCDDAREALRAAALEATS